MSETLQVDLSPVRQWLQVLREDISAVGRQVVTVSQQQEQTQSQLEQLYRELRAYIAADELRAELQLAETRLVKVRQELEQRFGHYAEVRRRATGILQATDAAIVRQETMRTAGEELMLAAPGYWLAPSLVALTSWIADNQPMAERALTEALRRDNNKTSLFFALVCRRAVRLKALNHWLARYFLLQSPQALDREVIVMLDAVASGIFGATAKELCLRVCTNWIEELEQSGDFLTEQRQRWAGALAARTPKLGVDEFPTLRRHTPTWPRLESSLAAARRNGVVSAYFQQLFVGEIPVPSRLEAAVDELLDSLVTHFDDEELPLRKEDRRLTLIVEEQGDRGAAERRMKAEEEAFSEAIPFSSLLTNAAMNPVASAASRATQRFAVAVSKDWIVAAHRDLVAWDRVAVPVEVELAIGPWMGKSQDGANETELISNMTGYYHLWIEQALSGIKLGALTVFGVISGVIGIISLLNGAWPACLVLLALGVGLFFLDRQNQDKARDAMRTQLEGQRDEALRILRACLAELVDYRRAWAHADGQAEEVTVVLESVRSDQHPLRPPEEARAVLQ